jgi:hypothetical protein
MRRMTVVAVALAAAACGTTTNEPQRDAGARDAAPIDAGYVVLAVCEPTLDSLETTIFQKACSEQFCHGDQGAFGLRLTVPDVASELVGVAAGSCAGWTRVVPGDLEHSLLYQKLTSDHPPCLGHRMPYGSGPLSPSTVRCVRGWIESLPSGDTD